MSCCPALSLECLRVFWVSVKGILNPKKYHGVSQSLHWSWSAALREMSTTPTHCWLCRHWGRAGLSWQPDWISTSTLGILCVPGLFKAQGFKRDLKFIGLCKLKAKATFAAPLLPVGSPEKIPIFGSRHPCACTLVFPGSRPPQAVMWGGMSSQGQSLSLLHNRALLLPQETR